ncbi:DUF1365 domain-containing protein [Amycolatopsis acidiphila]|uniref:DUF1365 domain-containing protein n=1 Tax=Amycolatopsis acidiphila TaxID=715473 RepID=A0A558AED0_9PSEU|nr:DUF1365 domain-containing protein [Amycolatopsis acidiphila]TVT22573.1 DUF1365 domain-containing protein [Amycolatopsis acidiphila]UIJ58791.1 DUF1365 domain-containing protein [Amycolatopsis acidiphila]GHG71977.1 DUF1365 domain-containing protein [Amycolatopsis acidiphila]
MSAAAIYDVEVTHARRDPGRGFTHRMYLWLVDLDELPVLPWWLRPFARFRGPDHLGDPGRPIRRNLADWLRTQGVDLRGGQVLMLAQASVLGYVFNPLTLYWCHRPGGALACVVAEVHNTYGGRHRYLLRPDETGEATVDKEFYVSPFLPVHGEYRMRVPRPADRLNVTITLRQDGRTSLAATMRGHRQPATPAVLLRILLTQPLAPQRVAALIRLHGMILWLRRVPIVPRDQEKVR